MQGSLRNYDGENCVSMGLCRIVSELVNYSFFPAVSEKPANNLCSVYESNRLVFLPSVSSRARPELTMRHKLELTDVYPFLP